MQPEQQNPESQDQPTPPKEVNAILGGRGRRLIDTENIQLILAEMTNFLGLPDKGLRVLTWEMTADSNTPNIDGLDTILANYGIRGYHVPQVSVCPPIPDNPCECSYYIRWDWRYGMVAGMSCACT